MEEKEKTRVIFKMTPIRKQYEELKSECIAFLLDCPANLGYVESYMHIGQHSEASIDFMSVCKPATPEQYKDLKWELEEVIGYDLILRKRWNRTRGKLYSPCAECGGNWLHKEGCSKELDFWA
jgi:hypothetical protein